MSLPGSTTWGWREHTTQTWRTLSGLHKGPHWFPGNQDHLKEEKEMKLCSQLLLQGLAGIFLRLTILSVQTGTCALIKVECCVYIPDLSGYISATLDDMKVQVKVMSDDNLRFWTSVLSWVKGDWWKTIFTIVIVALIGLLCGPFILQSIVNFVTQRLMLLSQIGGQRVRVQYIPMNDAHTMS